MLLAMIKNCIKKYWRIFLGMLVAIVGMCLFRKKADVNAIFKNERDAKQKEIDIINSANKAFHEKTKNEEILYNNTIREIEKKYKESQKALSDDTLVKVKDIIDKNKENPTEITRRISELTGYDIYVEKD
jgi:uncharacterized membrane protein